MTTRAKFRSVALGVLGLLWLGSFVAAAQNQPLPASAALTMQQAVDLAKIKNPTLLSAQQTLLSVNAQEPQAGVRANPYFTLAGSNVALPAEGASNPYSYSLQVSRLFERGEKRRWRLDSARSTTSQTGEQYHSQ